MPKDAIDLTGKKFGRWTVLSRVPIYGPSYWNCRCECGTERKVNGQQLRQGGTNSCGCLRREITTVNNTKHGEAKRGKPTPEYISYSRMISRCYNPDDQSYPRYGGRGIKVCDRWLGENGFINFRDDMGRRPSPYHSIERINNDGNYEPSNCKWASRKEQANNRSTTNLIAYNGKTQSIKAWADELGINRRTLQERIVGYGWSIEEALNEPIRGWSRFKKKNPPPTS